MVSEKSFFCATNASARLNVANIFLFVYPGENPAEGKAPTACRSNFNICLVKPLSSSGFDSFNNVQ